MAVLLYPMRAVETTGKGPRPPPASYVRKIHEWTAGYPLAVAARTDFAVDLFYNVDTPVDGAEAARRPRVTQTPIG
jgi:hypothetical protein